MREQFIDGVPYISKEQFYKLAHVRKTTALRLIQEGLVPAVDTGKQTKRYLIRLSDAEFYLQDRIDHPEKYSFQKKTCIQTYPKKFNRGFARDLSLCADRLWADEPPLLTVAQVHELLGYSEGVIRRWYQEYGLQILHSVNRLYIPKKSLLKFMKTKIFHGIQKKSAKHIELIRRTEYAGQSYNSNYQF